MNHNYTIPSTDSLAHRAAKTSRTRYTPYRGYPRRTCGFQASLHPAPPTFSPPLVVVSKRKSLIVHKHEPLSLAGADMTQGIAS